jgi:hypothetical protein
MQQGACLIKEKAQEGYSCGSGCSASTSTEASIWLADLFLSSVGGYHSRLSPARPGFEPSRGMLLMLSL